MPQPKRAADQPVRDPQIPPPARGDDEQMDRVEDSIKSKDPEGKLFATVLRETYDQLYDGERTGRFDPAALSKTERTHMGSLVEINLQRAFGFRDGRDTVPKAEDGGDADEAPDGLPISVMDYEIEGVQVDCKFSKFLGRWMIPREAVRGNHLLLVVWASDELSRWEAGLVRATEQLPDGTPLLTNPRGNQDGKRSLTAAGQARVRYLYDNHPRLEENLLLHLEPSVRDRILAPPSARRRRTPSGQAKVDMLFELVQQRIINRASIETVGQQKDPMKRVRDARIHLGPRGILILGHQDREDDAARGLGLPAPAKGSFVSAKVVEAEPGWSGPAAEIDGRTWRLAGDGESADHAPLVPKPSRKTG